MALRGYFAGRMTVGLFVSPLRRGSSEGLPAALTRPRDLGVLLIFGCILMESTQYRTVGPLKRFTIGDGCGSGGSASVGGVLPYSVTSRRLDLCERC